MSYQAENGTDMRAVPPRWFRRMEPKVIEKLANYLRREVRRKNIIEGTV
jgi:hypothetical protein